MRYRPLIGLLVFSLTLFAQNPGKQAVVKIQKTSMSRDQEIQLGKQAAAEVERTMEVIKNPEVETWLNQIGQTLAKTPQANAYPYYFKLLNEDSINAFALPGGPMYVHTGLIKAAASEGEVAGVLAHEMSHVALRHGAAQVGKQQTWGSVFGVIGAAAGIALGGQDGQCGVACQAAQMGAGLGGNSVLMKFSRGFEHDADLNGARMMASAGYNPMDMAKFFETLESKLGTAAEPKGLALWMSSHPATGNRVQYVSEDIKFYPQRSYNTSTGNFARVKQVVTGLPAPKPKPAAMLQTKQGASPRKNIPAGFKDYQAVGFAIAYPGMWVAGQADQGESVYLLPQGGAAKAADGSVELLQGAMVDYYSTQGGVTSLEAATADMMQSLKKGDSNLRSEPSSQTQIGGKPALKTRIVTRTSKQEEQTADVYTVVREAGLWHLVVAASTPQFGGLDPTFRQIVGSVQFPD